MPSQGFASEQAVPTPYGWILWAPCRRASGGPSFPGSAPLSQTNVALALTARLSLSLSLSLSLRGACPRVSSAENDEVWCNDREYKVVTASNLTHVVDGRNYDLAGMLTWLSREAWSCHSTESPKKALSLANSRQ